MTDVIIKNMCGTDAHVVATASVRESPPPGVCDFNLLKAKRQKSGWMLILECGDNRRAAPLSDPYSRKAASRGIPLAAALHKTADATCEKSVQRMKGHFFPGFKACLTAL